MSLEDFSIFDSLGMTEQDLKSEAKRPLNFWVRQVRETKDPAEALKLLNMAEE